jgi:hypothetical protein
MRHTVIACFLITPLGLCAQWLPDPYASGNINFMGGNVGIGTSQPFNTLSIKGRVGIRLDANPSSAAETLRVEGAITGEENVVNVTNLADQDFVIRLSGSGVGNKRTIIGPSVSTRFSLGVGVSNGNEYLTLVNGGNVGIGITTPSAKLHLLDVGSSSNATSVTNGNLIIQANTGGRNTTLGAQLEFVIPANSDGSNLWGQGRIITVAGNSGSGTATGKMILGTRRWFDKGVGTGQAWNYGDDIVIDGAGNVGIGTTDPKSFKLAVEGKIWAKEVQVALTNHGPDYVFEPTYHLKPLTEIETYIKENKHLPEVPSAKEMEKNGVQLGEMNMLLLKKVEELTLWVIELKKENIEAKEMNKQLADKIEKIEGKINNKN